MFLKRVNAHAERREQSTSVLETFLSIPQLSETRIKSGRSVLLFVCLFALRLKPLPDERERSNISHWIISLGLYILYIYYAATPIS